MSNFILGGFLIAFVIGSLGVAYGVHRINNASSLGRIEELLQKAPEEATATHSSELVYKSGVATQGIEQGQQIDDEEVLLRIWQIELRRPRPGDNGRRIYAAVEADRLELTTDTGVIPVRIQTHAENVGGNVSAPHCGVATSSVHCEFETFRDVDAQSLTEIPDELVDAISVPVNEGSVLSDKLQTSDAGWNVHEVRKQSIEEGDELHVIGELSRSRLKPLSDGKLYTSGREFEKLPSASSTRSQGIALILGGVLLVTIFVSFLLL